MDISCSANVLFYVTGVGTCISVPEIVHFLFHWMKVVEIITFVTISLLSQALFIMQNLRSLWYFMFKRSVGIFKLLLFSFPSVKKSFFVTSCFFTSGCNFHVLCFKVLLVIFVFLAPEFVTMKHLLYNFLLVLTFHWFWCMILLFIGCSHLNRCVKTH